MRAIGSDLVVLPEPEAELYGRDESPRFRLRAPAHWRSPIAINPHAREAERVVIRWLEHLGCTNDEIHRARQFDVAGYVGIPFPRVSCETTIRIAKHLSLWLLWDDVHVESLEHGWRIEPAHVLESRRPEGLTRFDEGWWELFSELAARRSARWLRDLCDAMIAWSDSARAEAIAIDAWHRTGVLPTFEEQLETRIVTIGMYPTLHLLEDALDHELPRELHEDPVVAQLARTSGEIVGLGNEIFSFGKDFALGRLNLVSTLMHEADLSGGEALEEIVRMHDRALERYDRLAASLGSWGAAEDPWVARWLEDIRHASLGFSLWEARAPRYAAHKVVVHGLVVEPSFVTVEDADIGRRFG
ncbi:terpene synthase family protein [Sandaracinus amylolyticus]|uniref:terpene synthase family protein n=1 Tax=Sandaracinus amylolyticus TaxID=927083 RepID=UPI001F2D9ECE|nr:terpene synthase family protein [Sandaracinus amylolyticus]UJR83780.1 Hypothetical protein I5071_58510 [Sandaracinus amylolyticus]